MTIRFKFCGMGTMVYDTHKSVFTGESNISIGFNSRIDGIVRLEGGQNLTIGDNVHIASFCHLNTGGGELIIGSHTGLASGVKIVTGQPDFSYLYICPNESEVHTQRFKTVIGSYVMVGVNCVLLPGITIGDGAIIGACSLVTKDVGSGEIWYGSPAKFIGMRQDDYYPLFNLPR